MKDLHIIINEKTHEVRRLLKEEAAPQLLPRRPTLTSQQSMLSSSGMTGRWINTSDFSCTAQAGDI